jgi:hypothetical protein
VGRYNEECLRIINSKVEKVDKDAYIKFVGKVKADLKLINGSKSEEDDGTVAAPAKFNDRFEERERKNDEQHKMLRGLDQRSKHRDAAPKAARTRQAEEEGE